ncbi:MAG: hypothetical protein NZ805_15370 [Armatimonadetes bacterium]|nr:hypothetical protein [Armatimonadota bacterium]MDW8029838.1 hypothetical protein [Armatimonadota bacterium]
MAKAKTAPKLTKEQVLAALKQLSEEDREWVLSQLRRKENKRKRSPKDEWWDTFLGQIVGIAEGSGGAVSEEHDKWVYVKDWEERNRR